MHRFELFGEESRQKAWERRIGITKTLSSLPALRVCLVWRCRALKRFGTNFHWPRLLTMFGGKFRRGFCFRYLLARIHPFSNHLTAATSRAAFEVNACCMREALRLVTALQLPVAPVLVRRPRAWTSRTWNSYSLPGLDSLQNITARSKLRELVIINLNSWLSTQSLQYIL